MAQQTEIFCLRTPATTIIGVIKPTQHKPPKEVDCLLAPDYRQLLSHSLKKPKPPFAVGAHSLLRKLGSYTRFKLL
jgi:hypothetical protein